MSLPKLATLVAVVTAALLAIVKLIVGIMSGSVAVLASAIDSILDLLISLFNVFAVTKAEEEASDRFNYGKGKIEALASVIEGTVITVSGLYILYESVQRAWDGEALSHMGPSMGVMLFSFIATGALVIFLSYVAKRTRSLVVAADALHYKTDLFTNGGILLSLVAIHFTGFHYLDSIVGAGIALYIIYSAVGLIKEGVYILLDAALSPELVEKIQGAIVLESRVTDYHFLKTRHVGETHYVEAHLVFSPEILLLEAHRASDHIEERIAALDPEAKWVFNFHLDPYDDSEIEQH